MRLYDCISDFFFRIGSYSPDQHGAQQQQVEQQQAGSSPSMPRRSPRHRVSPRLKGEGQAPEAPPRTTSAANSQVSICAHCKSGLEVATCTVFFVVLVNNRKVFTDLLRLILLCQRTLKNYGNCNTQSSCSPTMQDFVGFE